MISDDLAKRLRNHWVDADCKLLDAAADTIEAQAARIAELEAMVDADTQEMANTLKFADDRIKRAEARVAELDGALDILSRANQECNDALVAAEARVAELQLLLGHDVSELVDALDQQQRERKAAEARAERCRVAMIEASCWAGEHSSIDVHNVLTAGLNDTDPELP